MSRRPSPSSSHTIIASTDSAPWPMSLMPQNSVARPERSSFSCTADCGISFG